MAVSAQALLDEAARLKERYPDADHMAMAEAVLAERHGYLDALDALLDRYVQLVNCGDCGNWDPEEEDDVKAVRAVLAKARGGHQ